MTENEAISMLEQGDKNVYEADCTYEEYLEAIEMGRKALEEIQQYRTYKEIFENHFDEKVLKLFSNREEFGAWLERGKWIAKRCDEINKELEQYRAIGTVEEFNALKEKEERFDRNIRMFNEIGLEIRAKAIDEFAEKLSLEISESIIWGMLPTDCRDGVSDEIVDYVIDTSKKIEEQMKAGVENGNK